MIKALEDELNAEK